MARTKAGVWERANNSTDPWIEGPPLEIVLQLHSLQVGDHVRVNGEPRVFILEEYMDASHTTHPNTWLARTGPSPSDDWGIWIKPEHITAWRPKEVRHRGLEAR